MVEQGGVATVWTWRDWVILLLGAIFAAFACNGLLFALPLLIFSYVRTRQGGVVKWCLVRATALYWLGLSLILGVGQSTDWLPTDFPGWKGYLLMCVLLLPHIVAGCVVGHVLAVFAMAKPSAGE